MSAPKLDAATTHRFKNRKFGTPEQRFSAFEVWERDEGTCRICLRPIEDPTLPWPHPQAFVVDHKASRGGRHGPDTFENAQAAHRLCNSKKAGLIDGKARTVTSFNKREVLTARVDPALSAAVTGFAEQTHSTVNSIVSAALYEFLAVHDVDSGTAAITYASCNASQDLSNDSRYSEAIRRISALPEVDPPASYTPRASAVHASLDRYPERLAQIRAAFAHDEAVAILAGDEPEET